MIANIYSKNGWEGMHMLCALHSPLRCLPSTMRNVTRTVARNLHRTVKQVGIWKDTLTNKLQQKVKYFEIFTEDLVQIGLNHK